MTMIDYMNSWIDEISGHDKHRLEANKQKAEVGLAGSVLSRMRGGLKQRTLKRWTGLIGNGRRGYVGQTVVLPDHTLARLLAARHGWAAVAWVDPFAVRSNRISYISAIEIQPYKIPSAVTLGRLKAGCREKLSAAKLRACRRNGLRPPRKGSRPRGRPRYSGVAKIDVP